MFLKFIVLKINSILKYFFYLDELFTMFYIKEILTNYSIFYEFICDTFEHEIFTLSIFEIILSEEIAHNSVAKTF